ncbi:MAG: hypothetical protein WD766_13480 [Gemmatimonadota bacterium]
METKRAYRELCVEFDRKCSAPLNKAGKKMRKEFFEHTIGKLLDEGYIQWASTGEYQKAHAFTLRAAGQLGGRSAKAMQARVARSGQGKKNVNKADILTAVRELQPEWDRGDCPLPQIPVDELRKAGQTTRDTDLGNAIQHTLDEERGSSTPSFRKRMRLGCALTFSALEQF